MSKIAIVSFSLTGGRLAERIEDIINRSNRSVVLSESLMQEGLNPADLYNTVQEGMNQADLYNTVQEGMNPADLYNTVQEGMNQAEFYNTVQESLNPENFYDTAQVEVYALKKYAQINGQIPVAPSLSEWCGEQWKSAEVLIFIGASGIAVRTIAPYVKSKTSDPAVLVIDEGGHFVISLLSGHLGGANDWAEHLARDLKAIPVITTATDVEHLFAVDVWAKKNHLSISSMKLAKEVSADLLHGKKVLFGSEIPWEGNLPKELTAYNPEIDDSKMHEYEMDDYEMDDSRMHESKMNNSEMHDTEMNNSEMHDSRMDDSRMHESKMNNSEMHDTEINNSEMHDSKMYNPEIHDSEMYNSEIHDLRRIEYKEDTSTIDNRKEPGISAKSTEDREQEKLPVLIWCGVRLPDTDYPRDRILWLAPRCLALGVGCRRGKEFDVIVKRMMEVFDAAGLNPKSIDVIASIDLKKEEEGLIRLAEWLGVPFHTYSSEELAAVEGDYTPSSFVSQITGVDNVCERSAIRENGGQLIVRKQAGEGVTIAAAAGDWRITF